MDKRELKVSITKKGGNSSQNSLGYKLTLPTSWCTEWNIEQDNRTIIAEFDGEKIIITRKDQ